MGFGRNLLLWGSENKWMAKNLPNYSFVKKAVKRFMPGEKITDVIDITKAFNTSGILTTFTYLGENITRTREASEVTKHYIDVLNVIIQEKLSSEISLKLTQLGLNLSFETCLDNLKQILKKADENKIAVFIDMESSKYTELTIQIYKEVKKEYQNVGICLRAYLYSTEKSLIDLISLNPLIRLVKGAYKESSEIAFPKKSEVDKNYFLLSKILLRYVTKGNIRAALATHDEKLLTKIIESGNLEKISSDKVEFQMLYGIKTSLQKELTGQGYKISVLISYGEAWFPWYMRRLAERPANIVFVLKNIFR